MAIEGENTLNQEVIRFWIDLGSELGFPKTIGETYGVLFASQIPLSADDLVEQLGISRSGAGQALKTLQEIGAIRRASSIQSRKEHFEIQTDLSVLVRNFLSIRVFPKLNELNRQRRSIAEKANESSNEHLSQRFNKLDRWCEKSTPVIALLKAFIQE
jgi:Predicted transcriptional regulators